MSTLFPILDKLARFKDMRSTDATKAMLRCVDILNEQAKQKRLCAGNPEAPPDYNEALLADAATIEQAARKMERAWFAAMTPLSSPRSGSAENVA